MTPHISVSLLRTQSDERLASLAGGGHERAFEAIVERYGKPLRRYAQRFLSEARAEEVVQAAFLSAWTALGTGTEVRDLRPWLYRIVHNGALNAMQKAESGELELIEAPDGGISPHAALEQNEEIRSALSVIASLPERQRTALLAVAVDGRAHADVAMDLGVSDAGVRQLVRRARVQLRAGVTALTPLPLALWLANGHRNTSPDVTHRIAEMLGEGGGNALASTAFKAGAVVISVTAVAAGAPKVATIINESNRSTPAAAKIAVQAGAAGAMSGVTVGPDGVIVGAGQRTKTFAGVDASGDRGGSMPMAFGDDPLTSDAAPGGPGAAPFQGPDRPSAGDGRGKGDSGGGGGGGKGDPGGGGGGSKGDSGGGGGGGKGDSGGGGGGDSGGGGGGGGKGDSGGGGGGGGGNGGGGGGNGGGGGGNGGGDGGGGKGDSGSGGGGGNGGGGGGGNGGGGGGNGGGGGKGDSGGGGGGKGGNGGGGGGGNGGNGGGGKGDSGGGGGGKGGSGQGRGGNSPPSDD